MSSTSSSMMTLVDDGLSGDIGNVILMVVVVPHPSVSVTVGLCIFFRPHLTVHWRKISIKGKPKRSKVTTMANIFFSYFKPFPKYLPINLLTTFYIKD